MDEDHRLAGYSGLDRCIAELMITYHELNSAHVDELNEDPSPLEFMRYVAQNRPFVIRGGAAGWKAHQKWTATYLKQAMGGKNVTVATTLEGRADSVSMQHGQEVFTRPAYTKEPFEDVVGYIGKQELARHSTKDIQVDNPECPAIKYLQAQNDSLRVEYEELLDDVPASIPFARIALQRQPDAINFWLGNSCSVTQLHKDNYENIFAQIIGRKHFVLLPPLDVAAVAERFCVTADHEYNELLDVGGRELLLRYNESNERIPFPTWDPDKPDERATKFSQIAIEMRLTLNEGDMLYLPAQWYHKVSQSCNSEGVCCAVNYWYDMEFPGAFHPSMSFIRSAAELATREHC